MAKISLNSLAHNESLEYLKYFISKGADPYIKDYNNNNALHIICKNYHNHNHNHNHIIPYLIENFDFDIEAKNIDGNTALHLIYQNFYVPTSEFIEQLIEKYGIDDTKNNEGLTPFLILMKFQPSDYISKNLASKYKSLRYLIKKNVNAKAKDNNWNNALHLICKEDNVKLKDLNFLIEECNLEIDSKNIFNETPFILLSKNNNNLNGLKYLKEQGANVNAKTFNDENALYFASINNNFKIVKWLINNTEIVLSKPLLDFEKKINSSEIKNLLLNFKNTRKSNQIENILISKISKEESNLVNLSNNFINNLNAKFKELEELERSFKQEIKNKNNVFSFIRNNFEVLKNNILSQKEKNQELELDSYIQKNQNLLEYHYTLQMILNSTIEASRIICSGLVAQELDTSQVLTGQAIGAIIGKTIKKCPIPFSDLASSAIQWGFKRYAKEGINALANFFPNSIIQSKAIEKLSRQITISKRKEINKLPFKQEDILTKFTLLKNKITGNNINNNIKKYAKTDQEKILEIIMKKELSNNYYNSNRINEIFIKVMGCKFSYPIL